MKHFVAALAIMLAAAAPAAAQAPLPAASTDPAAPPAPEMPNLGMYHAAMQADRADLHTKLRVYVGGVADGIMATELLRAGASGKQSFCHPDAAGTGRGPSRGQALAMLDAYASLAIAGNQGPEWREFPVPTVMTNAFGFYWPCPLEAELRRIRNTPPAPPPPAAPPGETPAALPDLAMMWAIDRGVTRDAETVAVFNAYFKGVSDGAFAAEMSRRSHVADAGSCYTEFTRLKLPPTREEAADALREFSLRLARSSSEQEAGAFPIAAVLPLAMAARYPCAQAEPAP